MVNLLQITIKANYQRNISARLIKFGLTESTILKRRISPVLHQVKTLKILQSLQKLGVLIWNHTTFR